MAYTDDWEILMNGVFGAGGKLKFGGAQPQPEKPVPQPEPQPVAAPQKQPKAKNAPETLLPQEELEQREMQQLKDMLNGMSGKAKPAPQPVKPVQAAPQQPKVQPALHKRPPRSCRRLCLPALRQTRKRCRKSLRKSLFSKCSARQRTKSPLPTSRKKRIP